MLVWLIVLFFMTFAVFDPSPLTVCINCSFGATVCKTVRLMLSDRCPVLSVCLSCLSVTLIYCGQTVGWIKMKLSTEVGLGPAPATLY